MDEKFKGRYRIPSARWQRWNYGSNGAYFVTICSAGRQCMFGNIIDGKMHLSPIGEIALAEWEKSLDIRPNMFCDAFVIMPNHIHAILRIDNDRDAQLCVSTNPQITNSGVAYRSPKSISSFMACFKSTVTKRCGTTIWQTRYHDRVIRDDAEYQRISEYIQTNPLKWETDDFFNQE